jgi:hypothetical protein
MGKVEFTPTLMSEYNMTQYDIARIDKILQKIDDYTLMIGEGDSWFIIAYLNGLRAFYRYLRPLLNSTERQPMELAFSLLYHLVYSEGEYNLETFMKIEWLHNQLLSLRQSHSLGLFAGKKQNHPGDYMLKPEFRGDYERADSV